MDVNIEQRNVFIALGVLSGLGVIIAFIRTWKWFTRSGKEIIDLAVIIYHCFICVIPLYFNRQSANLFFIYLVLLVLLFFLLSPVFQLRGYFYSK
jgi:multisubunit Na+/H+ antiporter MnhG subunit